jgi:carbon monoxide dehydrogenase subunit G
MAIDIKADFQRTFEVSQTPAEAYVLLSNVPASVAHFPKLQSLTARDDNIYEWLLEGETVRSKSFAAEYACQYHCDPDKKTVVWSAIPGFGNSKVTGHWKLTSKGTGTQVDFQNSFHMILDVPRLFKAIAVPIIKRLNGQLIEKYMKNISKTLNGGQGALRDLH